MPTNDYSKNIVYLSKEQYQELITNETLTVNDQTITYNDNDIYVTPQAEPITDVKINGTSIGSNGVANIPAANTNELGLVKVENLTVQDAISNGGSVLLNNIIYTVGAPWNKVKNGSDHAALISAARSNYAAFYGLAKAAGHDEKDSTEPLGTYTDGAKAAIQNMLGITDLISTEESSTATAAHTLNSTFMMGGKLYKATAAIAIGDAVVEGENCEVVKADEVFVKNTDYATSQTAGVIKASGYGVEMGVSGLTGHLVVRRADSSDIKSAAYTNYCIYRPIVPYNQHEAVFYGLSKVAGVDLANETVTLGTYPETSKTAIRSLIGAAAASDIPSVPVQDVQMNGTSILNQGIANIPVASSSNLGVVRIDINYGIGLGGNNKTLFIQGAENTDIKTGTNAYKPIVPITQHTSIFYGLSKLAGVNLANETVTVGTYPETSKTAIRTMIGAGTPLDVQINGTSIIAEGVANVPIGGISQFGVVKSANGYGVGINGADGRLEIVPATSAQLKSATANFTPITPNHQHESVFYGLAKAAGDATQSASTNAVGTYTDSAKASIKSMLGIADGSTGTVDITETTPSITAIENTRYVCGEVSTLSFTPAASGICIVRFTSGSTPTVLTVPNTVKFPEWFDITALEADTIYEMCITDGIYGAVMSWVL